MKDRLTGRKMQKRTARDEIARREIPAAIATLTPADQNRLLSLMSCNLVFKNAYTPRVNE